MDKSNPKAGTTFTAEEVRKYLVSDNDYDDSSTSSSDDNSQDEKNLDFSSILTEIDSNESDNETIIPHSPKKIKTITPNRKNGRNEKNVFINTCIQMDVTGGKVEHGTVQYKTSGNNPSLETLHNLVTPQHPKHISLSQVIMMNKIFCWIVTRFQSLCLQ